MKKSIWVVIAIAAAILLGVGLMEFRERGFFSSYAAPAEKPAINCMTDVDRCLRSEVERKVETMAAISAAIGGLL